MRSRPSRGENGAVPTAAPNVAPTEGSNAQGTVPGTVPGPSVQSQPTPAAATPGVNASEQGPRRGASQWGAYSFVPGRGWTPIAEPANPTGIPSDAQPQPNVGQDAEDAQGQNPWRGIPFGPGPGWNASANPPRTPGAGPVANALMFTLGIDFTFTALAGESGPDNEDEEMMGGAEDQVPPQSAPGPPPAIPRDATSFFDHLFSRPVPEGLASPNARTPPVPRRKDWVLPAAPGLTLRQRVEKKEREAGLRCWDVSCGVGPTDDDPESASSAYVSAKQVAIRTSSDVALSNVCEHTFHPACLVTAERVSGWGCNDVTGPAHSHTVSCPVCREVGHVDRKEWEEGAQALA